MKALYKVARRLIQLFQLDLNRATTTRKNGTIDDQGCWNVISHVPDALSSDSSDDEEEEDTSDDDSDDESNDEGNRTNIYNQNIHSKTNIHVRPIMKTSKDNQQSKTTKSSLHISLTKPFYLQNSNLASFASLLHQHLSSYTSSSSSSLAITLEPSKTRILLNESKTRSFLCIPLHPFSNAIIENLIRKCIDPVMLKFGGDIFYEDCACHVSVASVCGDVQEHLAGNTRWGDAVVGGTNNIVINADKKKENDTNEKNDPCDDGGVGEESPITIMMDQIHCTLGTTKEYVFHLSNSSSSTFIHNGNRRTL